MLAHVAGLPLEEALLWLLPTGGSVGLLAFVHSQLLRGRGRGAG
jgi:hypothetical protein